MARSNTFRTFLASLAVATFTLAAFTGAQTNSSVVSKPHLDIIQANEGSAAPYGPWTPIEETVALYFHRDSPEPMTQVGTTNTFVPGAPARGSPATQQNQPASKPNSDYYLDYERPVTNLAPQPVPTPTSPTPVPTLVVDQSNRNDHKVVITDDAGIGGPAAIPVYFTLPVELAPTESVRLNKVEADIFANCSPDPTNLDGTVQSMRFDLQVLDKPAAGSPWTPANIPSSYEASTFLFATPVDAVAGSAQTFFGGPFGGPGQSYDPAQQVLRFQGSLDLGIISAGNGLRLQAESRLQVLLVPAFNDPGSCTIHFDTVHFPSRILVTAESARIASWIERDGKPVAGLPPPTSNVRSFDVKVLHVSAWPQLDGFRNNVVVGPQDGDANPPNLPGDHMKAFWNQGDASPAAYRNAQPDYDFNQGIGSTVGGLGNPQPFNSGPPVAASTMSLRIRDVGADTDASGGGPTGFVLGAGQSTSLKLPAQTLGTANSVKLHTFPAAFGSLTSETTSYQVEVFATDGAAGVARSLEFRVGAKGFTFALGGVSNCLPAVSTDPAVHCVNPSEPTTFRLLLNNTGASSDTIDVKPVAPGDNWKSEVLGDLHFLGANGGQAEVLVRVTPPPTALDRTNKTLSFTAASTQFPGEVATKTQSVTVKVVDGVRRAVALASPVSGIEMKPGQTAGVGGVRVTNLGTEGGIFSLAGTVSTSFVGWSASTSPNSAFIEAGGSYDFQVSIKAAASAADGTVVPVTLRTQLVGDATKQATATILAEILAPVGLVLSSAPGITQAPTGTNPENALARPRIQDSTGFCSPDVITGTAILPCNPSTDTKFDNSFLFRIAVTNPGSLPDTYRIVGGFAGGVSGASFNADSQGGNDSCDSPGPRSSVRGDHWRFALDPSGSGMNVNGSPGGTADVFGDDPGEAMSLLVQPGETRYIYLDLGVAYNILGGENNCSTPSPSQAYRVQLTSSNDHSVVRSVLLGAALAPVGAINGPDDYGGALYGVELEPDVSDPDVKDVVLAGQTAVHTFRVRNLSNQLSEMQVYVGGSANSNGFKRELEFVGTASVPPIPANQPATQPNCIRDSSNPLIFNCGARDGTADDIGVLDELVFNLKVTPDANLDLQRALPDLTEVHAKAEGLNSATLQFRTEATGTFLYSATALNPSKTVQPAKSVTLPFVIRNLGTNGDTYETSLIAGNLSWKPRLSLPASSFVAAGKDLAGYVTVTAPVKAPKEADKTQTFRVLVRDSGNSPAVVKILDFAATWVGNTTLRVDGRDGANVVVPQAGVPVPVTLRVTDTATGAAGQSVTVSAIQALPPGWTVQAPSRVSVPLSGTPATGEVTFSVVAPDSATATSRAVLTVEAVRGLGANAVSASTDLVLNRADSFGVHAFAAVANLTVDPSKQVKFDLRVRNDGLGDDTFSFANSALPAGWGMQFAPALLGLAAQESGNTSVLLDAPASAKEGDAVSTTVFVISKGDPSKIAQVPLRAVVGFHRLNVTVDGQAPKIGPEETATFVLHVRNTGNLPDEVKVNATLLAPGQAPFVTLAAPARTLIQPGEGADIPVTLQLTPAALPGIAIEGRANVTSIQLPGATAGLAYAVVPLRAQVLPFVAADADQDGLKEYAVDRDGDASNGYEAFVETRQPGGKQSRAADLAGFLTESARQSFERVVAAPNGTTVTVLDYVVDGDRDGKRDLFVDSSGDNIPDAYWDPDDGAASPIVALKDLDSDGQPELLVDTNAVAPADAAFDLKAGTFTALLQKDVDLDGTLDFVVDANGNGRVDPDETILLSRTGKLVTVLQVDVNGDGRKDAVYDADGDDRPDFFIPAGEQEPVAIVLKDVTGDGKADWTFDADGDGVRESYYNPATGQSSVLRAQNAFLDGLVRYWYVGALFLVVVALFVVLLVVTRR